MGNNVRHICFVSSEFAPGTRGGIGRLINATAHQLSSAGWRLTFLLDADSEAVQTFRAYARDHFACSAVYQVEELLHDITPQEDIPSQSFRFPKYYRSYRIALALHRLCRKHLFNGIEFTDYLGLGYVTLKWRRLWGDPFSDTPMWVRLHGTAQLLSQADDAPTFSRELQQLFTMEHYSLRHADGWICPSASVADWYREIYGRQDVPVVIATPGFERLGSGRSHPRVLHDPPYRLLYYGKLQHLKGTDTFIRAAVVLCETTDLPLQFEVVGQDELSPWGTGSYREELERLIPSRWRDRFHFHGSIHPDQLEQLALGCTLAVVPSRVETFCLAAHELHWIGIPLVLNDLPAFRAYFTDGRNCRLFDGTSADLARVLRELLSQPNPFAEWEWHAPHVVAGSNGSAAYDEALNRFRPLAPPQLELSALVSVIVPFGDTQDVLDATLDSVRASSYKKWELLIVGAGVHEPAVQACLAQLRQGTVDDARYRFVRCERGGWGAALNDGIRQSRGAYILPLASGTSLHPHYLERAVQALQRAPELAAVCCFAGKVPKQQSADQLIEYTIPYDLHPLLVTLEHYAEDSCSLFRRAIFDNVRYDEDLIAYEDWELWWQLAEAGFQVEVMPALLSYQRLASDHPDWADIHRHVYVMHKLADRHSSYLQRLSDGIFRFCAAETTELRAYVDELQHDRDRLWSEIERLKQLFEERDHNWQAYTQELINQREDLLAEIRRLQQVLDGREQE